MISDSFSGAIAVIRAILSSVFALHLNQFDLWVIGNILVQLRCDADRKAASGYLFHWPIFQSVRVSSRPVEAIRHNMRYVCFVVLLFREYIHV